MITTQSLRGRVALMVGHCAGMVDLVALPVWVGTLISVYRFDPQQAVIFLVVFGYAHLTDDHVAGAQAEAVNL